MNATDDIKGERANTVVSWPALVEEETFTVIASVCWSMANSATKTELKIDLSSILSNVKFELFKEVNNIQRDTEAVGLDVSQDLQLVFEELCEHIREYASEVQEVLVSECADQSIVLIDESVPSYNFPDDSMDLVTCKKCLFQWDGNAQHICD